MIVLGALALAAAAVRLVLVREGPPRRGPLGLPRAAWAIATVAAVNGLIWAVLVPPWQAPDEVAHFAYTQYLAETGHTSVDPHATSNYSTEQQYAMENGLTNTYRNSPRGRPPWRQVDRRLWEARDARTDPSRSNGGGAPSLNYTPEYYALGAGLLRLRLGRRLRPLVRRAPDLGTPARCPRCSGPGGSPASCSGREGFLPNTAALCVALLPEFGFISGSSTTTTCW